MKKRVKAGWIIAIVILLLIAGAFIMMNNFGKKAAKVGDKIKVEYTGSLENGTIFDSSNMHNQLLEFQVGAGQMIKGFDEAVIGMKIGEEKTIKLQPSEAYGNYNPELIATIPRSQLPDERPISPGTVIWVGSPTGQQMPALITEVRENNFTIDLNHPLAGKTLIFKVKVVEISS